MCGGSRHPVASAVPAPFHVEHQPVGRFFSGNLTSKTIGRSWSSLLHGGGASGLRCCFHVFASQGRKFEREQQLKLSVLRFTLGKPNHKLQRSEALGLCLAAFSTTLPYIGEILMGENQVDPSVLSEGNKQIFIMSETLLDSQKEDLAWASFVLLRNTNAISVFIVVQNASCIRGYWNVPHGSSKSQKLGWFLNKFLEAGFLDLKDTLYFPNKPDPELQQILPKGAASVLVQPVFGGSGSLIDGIAGTEGFILLVSSAKYAFNEKDKAWVTAISKKFQENQVTFHKG